MTVVLKKYWALFLIGLLLLTAALSFLLLKQGTAKLPTRGVYVIESVGYQN